ncbi:hypothetical protein DY052_08535 [Apilactobacillus timberlakei]|uniref:DUF5776 domain-containing protein n=1 Tax=Apilactobacillus timberlakei TaxID=2008380 RepID=UPI0011268366|nr:DUF5776 domain-containing protein [Apilactobacillus timberlakei]TPR13037.1 hypothetical protein DY052_08535 [Apilactobacillus timberlakei]
MLSKNNQAKLQKLSQDQTVKYKLRKKGKQWFNLTLTTTALGIGFFALSTTTIHADVNPNQVVQQTQTNSNPANSDEQHNEHATSEVNHDQVTTQHQTTDQADIADVHTGSSDDTNKQAITKDNQKTASNSDDKQSENTISHDSKENAHQIDKQNPNKTSANNNPSHEQSDVVDTNGKQDNSSDDDSKVIDPNKSNDQSPEEQDNNNSTQPQPSVDDKSKNTAKDEMTTQQSTDKNKDMQDSQSPSDNVSHSDNKKQDLDNQRLVNGQAPNGQVKDTDANHQPITKDDLAKASKDNNISLLENKLSDQFAGGNHLKLAQMKLAAANNDSNDIPAPDRNGNYNWNSDQFAAAKAKNAVHSGMWGTAQWFIDKNNNLFISNGSLNNIKNTNSSPAKVQYNDPNNFGSDQQFQFYFTDDKMLPLGYQYAPAGDMLPSYTNGELNARKIKDLARSMNITYPTYDLDVYISNEAVTANTDVWENNAQGLASSVINEMGNNNNINLNTVNFTSSISMPKDASNIFSKMVASHKYGNNEFSHNRYKVRFQYSGLDLGQGYLDGTSSSLYANNVDKTTNMGIRKITGYGNMNTSQTENMHNLFGGQAVDPDTSNWDFSSAKDLSNMEAGTHATNLDLSNKDLSKVTDFSNMANTPTLRNANLNNDTISDSANKANMLNGSVQEVSFNSKDTHLDNLGLSFNNWVNADNLGAKPITTSDLTNGTAHSGTWVVPNSAEYYQILNDASESDQDKILDTQTPQIANNNQSAAQTIQKQVDKTKSLLDNTDAQGILNKAYDNTSGILSNNQKALDAFKNALSDYQQNKSIKTRKALTDARNKLISSNQNLSDQINTQMQANSDAIIRQKLANISEKANEIADENLNTQNELNDQLSDIKEVVKDNNILNTLNNVASGVNEIVSNVKKDEVNLNNSKNNDEINRALNQLNQDNARLKYAANIQSKINSSAFIQQEVVDANNHAEMVKKQYINYKDKVTNPDIKDKFNQAIDEFNDLESKLNVSHNGLISILTNMNVLSGNEINTNSIDDLGNNINNAKNQLSDSINNLNNSSDKNSTAFIDFVQKQATYDLQNTVNQAKAAQQNADNSKEQQDMAALVAKDQAQLQDQINADNSKMNAQQKAAVEDKANALAQKTAEDTQKLNQMIEQTKSDDAKKEQQDLDNKDKEDQSKLEKAVADATDAQRRADDTKEQQDMAAQVAKDKAELQNQIDTDNSKMDAQQKAAADDKANALAQKTAEDTQKLNQMIEQTKSDDAKKEQQDMADKDAKHQQELQDAVAQAKLAQQKADSSQEQQDMADQIQKDTDQLNTKLKEQADADNSILNSQKAADQQAAIDKVKQLLIDDTNKLNKIIEQTKSDDAKKEQQDMADKDKSDAQKQQDAVDKAKQDQQQQDDIKEQQDLANQVAQQKDAISKATQAQKAADSSKEQQDLVQQIAKDKSDLQNQMNEDNNKLNDKGKENEQLKNELTQKTQQLNDLTYKLNKMIGQSNQQSSSNNQPIANGYNNDSLNVQSYSIPSDNRYDDLKADQANKLKQDVINARHLKTYIQPNEVTEDNNTVTLSKDIYVHTGKDFYHDQKLRKIKAGQQIKVLRVIKYKGITRFELADHTYITTNRSFVQLSK